MPLYGLRCPSAAALEIDSLVYTITYMLEILFSVGSQPQPDGVGFRNLIERIGEHI